MFDGLWGFNSLHEQVVADGVSADVVVDDEIEEFLGEVVVLAQNVDFLQSSDDVAKCWLQVLYLVRVVAYEIKHLRSVLADALDVIVF